MKHVHVYQKYSKIWLYMSIVFLFALPEQKAFAGPSFSTQISFYSGVELSTGMSTFDPTVLTFILGGMGELDILAQPDIDPLFSYHSDVNFHVEYDVFSENPMVFVPDDILGIAILDNTTYDSVGFDMLDDLNFLTDFTAFTIQPHDLIVVMTADDMFFKIGDFVQRSDMMVQFRYQQLEEVTGMIPEPSTFLLLGVGVIGIFSFIRTQRKTKRIMSIFLFLVMVCSVFGVKRLPAQTFEYTTSLEDAWTRKAADAYIFPVQPGTPEWESLNSGAEMLEVCQIPESILQNMSTEGLVETCLNYPLFLNITAYDTLPKGLKQVIAGFSGLQELLRRKDAGTALLEKYKTMEPDKAYKEWLADPDSGFFLDFLYIETLFVHDTILATMSLSVKKELLQECLQKYDAMQQLSTHYGTGSLASIVLIMAKIMEKEKYAPMKQRVSNLEQTDVNKIRQERPELKNVEIIPLSGQEQYELFLQGYPLSKQFLQEIVLSTEQFLAE